VKDPLPILLEITWDSIHTADSGLSEVIIWKDVLIFQDF